MQTSQPRCRMSGGDAGGGGGGAITLEELQGLGDEEEEEEEEGDCPEHEQRLLGFWQSVARGHRVDVPPDMAQPIQQLTRNNHAQGRENIPFTVIKRKEKFGKVLYEKRHYAKGRWACVKVQEGQYEQSVCLGFMKIMKYICEQNSSGLYLGMTVPIVTIIHTGESTSDITRFVTVAYYLPGGLQDQPPDPHDPDIIIEEWPPAVVYARNRLEMWPMSSAISVVAAEIPNDFRFLDAKFLARKLFAYSVKKGFGGVTNEDSIAREINLLAELLEHPEQCLRDTFIVAGYTNPAAATRLNEIWFLERL